MQTTAHHRTDRAALHPHGLSALAFLIFFGLLLLAPTGKLPQAHAELLQATTLSLSPESDNPALKARAYRALARIDQTANPSAASDELLQALKLSPETPDDILLSGELAEASGDS